MGHGWVTAPVGSQKTKASEFAYGLDKENEKKKKGFVRDSESVFYRLDSQYIK